ncbi:MAG: amino-acid N-acetyltransferase [Pseudomonadales bacterium]|nr:amino-acid N-acetyltransferase [Pseudomonadales bacterium]
MSNSNEPADQSAPEHKLVHWFRHATPYINEHRGKTFVLMIGGDAVESDGLRNIIHDIVLLNSLGVRIVIIHGVRKQLDEQLIKSGIKSQFIRSWRVTDKDALDAAIQACSLVRAQLETRLSMGLPNSPMHGAKVRVASGNVITAKPAGIIDGVDLQHAGLVRKFDTDSINTLLELGNIVLLSPLGYSPAGEAFSLAYDDVASELAVALGAEKLIIFCEPGALLYQENALLRELSLAQAEQLLDQAHATPSYLKAAIHAVKHRVPRAHLLNFNNDGALLEELFTVDGAGTLISQRNFESVRLATEADIPAILDIIEPLETNGVLVKRNREKLTAEINHFTLIEREGLLVALAALYPYASSEENSASTGEIACIATHPDYRNDTRGKKLLQTIEASAKEQGIKKLFVLTTQTTHWFIEQGFQEGSLDDLPKQKQLLYNYQRNSKVFTKPI